MRRGGSTFNPSNQDPAQLIDATYCRTRIVHCGRDSPERDVDELDHSELNVLLHRAVWADVERRKKMRRSLICYPLGAGYPQNRHTRRNKLPHAALDAN